MGEEEHTPSPIDIFVVSQALMAGFPLFLAAQLIQFLRIHNLLRIDSDPFF